MSRPKQLYWIGARNAAGRAIERFGGDAGVYEPIPARDLTPEETAGLTEAQWACIDSTAGKRLYSGTKPDGEQRHANQPKTNQASGSSTAPSPPVEASA